MDMLDFASAVAIGNLLTICIVLSLREFQRQDYKAPWLAYAGFVIPVLFLLASVWANR